jgi:hypothetical protein
MPNIKLKIPCQLFCQQKNVLLNIGANICESTESNAVGFKLFLFLANFLLFFITQNYKKKLLWTYFWDFYDN